MSFFSKLKQMIKKEHRKTPVVKSEPPKPEKRPTKKPVPIYLIKKRAKRNTRNAIADKSRKINRRCDETCKRAEG